MQFSLICVAAVSSYVCFRGWFWRCLLGCVFGGCVFVMLFGDVFGDAFLICFAVLCFGAVFRC